MGSRSPLAANVAPAGSGATPAARRSSSGCVGGVLFGLVAGFVKLTLQELNAGGVGAMLTAWPTYALVLAGAGGVLTNQRAYRVAGLSASMPALNIVNGMTSLALRASRCSPRCPGTPRCSCSSRGSRSAAWPSGCGC